MLSACTLALSVFFPSFSFGPSRGAAGWAALAFSAAVRRCSQMLPLAGAGPVAGVSVCAGAGVVADACFCGGASVCLVTALCFGAGVSVCLFSAFECFDCCACGGGVLSEAAGFGGLLDVRVED